ncbi:FAD-dependent oxidoreductase [Arthrobacter sp. 18067]|uniref:FAD-dependent oxidoreductase n=1 Tax=Arthrobacter sp. 18067 TaxID=2681413 RepID=UPI001356DDE6|nr:FAD-dependent oxidoreductase [Arthrobacter sp. 18067]
MSGRLEVAVVGSGPSGAYCVGELCETADLDVRIDVFERLPTPFGLVRYGVAPDHEKIKSITSSFDEIFEDPKVRFFGNVRIGADVALEELRQRYDAVILAHGARSDRTLNVDGEDQEGIHPARALVDWYSGHPDGRPDALRFTTRSVVVIGAGNVALDVARMLCRTPEELRQTDVPEYVIEALAASSVTDVHVLARRGPAFAKYSNKELLELAHMEDARVVIEPAEFELDVEQKALSDANAQVRRRIEIIKEVAESGRPDASRRIHLRFGLAPETFLGDGHVSGVRCTSPRGEVDIDAGLVFRSIGFRSDPLEGVPFDPRTATVPNERGRVLDGSDTARGLYVTGWVKRGPSGVIGTNRRCAMETVEALLEDWRSGGIGGAGRPPHVSEVVTDGSGVVDWAGWRAIDNAEVAYGETLDRGRVKIHDLDDLLEHALRAKP